MKQDSSHHMLRDLRKDVEDEAVVYHATLVDPNGQREHVTVAAGHPAFADVEELYFTHGSEEVGLVRFTVSLAGSSKSLANGSLPASSVTPVANG